MGKKWMPITAGILEILAGFGILTSSYFFLGLLYIEARRPYQPWYFLSFLLPFLGILSVVGGVFALKRKKWKLAFTGAAAAIPLPLITLFGSVIWTQDVILELVSFVLGFLISISLIVLLRLSRREFK